MDFLKIPLVEILLATENFAMERLIGADNYAREYKAEIDVLDIERLSSLKGECKDQLPKTRKTVTVSRITAETYTEDKQSFLTEVELIASCKHPNIISLLGFCRDKGEMILVYEFSVEGPLSRYLNSSFRATNFTWGQRLQICLDIAYGIDYLHTNMEGKPRIIHRGIKSDNILLDENLKAKVAIPEFRSKDFLDTDVYLDPEYTTSSVYTRESDVYSFGVVLFEVLSGILAFDRIYTDENSMGLAPVARRCYNERKLKQLIDPIIAEEVDDHIFTFNRGPNQDSFNTFSKIAYQCLAETRTKRPSMDIVITELQKALKLQGETVVLSKFQLSDILLATDSFSETYCIDLDPNGHVYKAKLRNTTVAIKHITNRKRKERKQRFLAELEMGTNYKHPNIVSLLGFCDEGDENILVYEHASHESLDDYLKIVDKIDNFSWTQRLYMCLEIARGLNHLHTKMLKPHCDIKSANILLYENGKVKIAYFGISKLHPTNQEISTKVYQDPEYEMSGKLDIESDIYSFGVVLFEIFCGRVAYDSVYIKENDKGIAPVARQCLNDGAMERLMDPKLKEENDEDISTLKRRSNQDSIDTFLKIAYQCLGEVAKSRPTAEMVIKELELALNFCDPLASLEYV